MEEFVQIDVRLIAATNRDPGQAIRDQHLREDLYYRIQVFTLQLPPLRERAEDVPLLVEHFLRKLGGKLGIAPGGITPLAVERLCQYPWPGNVRELENVIERRGSESRRNDRCRVSAPRDARAFTRVRAFGDRDDSRRRFRGTSGLSAGTDHRKTRAALSDRSQ